MHQSHLKGNIYTGTLPLVVPFNTVASPATEQNPASQAMAMLALTHSPVEHCLYKTLLTEVVAAHTRICTFSLRQLMTLTQLPNYSAIRRGLSGLVSKLSIEQHKIAGIEASSPIAALLIFTPEEIFVRRTAVKFAGTPTVMNNSIASKSMGRAIEHLANRYDLSRRESQVALCCVQGMTNLEIGEQLCISEQTVKFHLRHIFVKYGVKRRAELISRLLATDG